MYAIEITTDTTAVIQAITDNSSKQLHWYQDLQQRTFDLLPGTEIDIEAGGLAIGTLKPGNTYHVTGSWLNHTKNLTAPRFMLGITSAQLITF